MDTVDYRLLPPIHLANHSRERLIINVVDAHRSEGRVARFDILAYGPRDLPGQPTVHRGVSIEQATDIVRTHMCWHSQRATYQFLAALYDASVALRTAMVG